MNDNTFSWCKSQQITDMAIKLHMATNPQDNVIALQQLWYVTMEEIYDKVKPFLKSDPVHVAEIIHSWMRSKSKYEKTGTDFISFLMNQEYGCNCNCGSIFLLAALECLGLFPSKYFYAQAQHGHVYLMVNKNNNDVIFETTVDRPFVCEYVSEEKRSAFYYSEGLQNAYTVDEVIFLMLKSFLFDHGKNETIVIPVIENLLSSIKISPSKLRFIIAHVPALLQTFPLTELGKLLEKTPKIVDFPTLFVYEKLIGEYVSLFLNKDEPTKKDEKQLRKIANVYRNMLKSLSKTAQHVKLKQKFNEAKKMLLILESTSS